MPSASAMPAWKAVACPTCGAGAGLSCGKRRMGSINQWVRCAPHAARKRLGEVRVFAVGEVVLFTKSMRACEVIEVHEDGRYTVSRVDTGKQMVATAAGLRKLSEEGESDAD